VSKQLADLVDRVAQAAADFGAAADEVDAAAATALRVNRTDLRLLGLVTQRGSMSAGALAAAAGLAVGLATPATERENELLGQAREQLVRSAQESAEETLDKVQQVATDAGDTVRKAAAEQKLTV
jgi:hypothetical protein